MILGGGQTRKMYIKYNIKFYNRISKVIYVSSTRISGVYVIFRK